MAFHNRSSFLRLLLLIVPCVHDKHDQGLKPLLYVRWEHPYRYQLGFAFRRNSRGPRSQGIDLSQLHKGEIRQIIQ